MEHYSLKQDEVCLFKGNLQQSKKGTQELILTNYNLVLITKKKRLLKENVDVFTHPAMEVKLYKSQYQVMQKSKKVEVYFLDCEQFFDFQSKKDANLFVSAYLKFLTGKTKFERGVDKTKENIQKNKLKFNYEKNYFIFDVFVPHCRCNGS